jgi:murein DD-endopeptidase MepM/ murein hydrolase activator NlpD
LAALAVAPASNAAGFTVVDPRVSPSHAYVDGAPVQIAFHLRARAPVDLLVDVTGAAMGRRVRRFVVRGAAPGVRRRLRWDALDGRGRVVDDGRYLVTVTPRDGAARRVGSLVLHGHFFPIRGPHADRGGLGAFGQPRSGGRIHEGFDVNAACGTPLVAARGGRVIRSNYDRVLYGHIVIIRNRAERRDYWYAHLQHPARVPRGQDVTTGERLGEIGATGNARTVGCHLHFEIHQDGVPIDPAPSLHAWDTWS